MKGMYAAVSICLILLLVSCAKKNSDPYLWLEDVLGEKSLAWVEEQNKATLEDLSSYADFKPIKKDILNILDANDRIAYPSIVRQYIYNFWQDDQHPRGVWRRTSLKEYFRNSPRWETVLDIDSLSEAENEKWAYKGASFLYPDYKRCLIHLSRGGSDAVEIREFNLVSKEFLQDGFFLKAAKSSVNWIDPNTIMVSTDFGDESLTESGYPSTVKIWERGTDLNDATVLYQGKKTDMGVWGFVIDRPERQYVGLQRMMNFYSSEIYMKEGDKLSKLDIPDDATFGGFFKGQLLVELKSDWTPAKVTYKQGSLISIDYDLFRSGSRDFTVIVAPEKRSSIVGFSTTRDYLLINMLNNVRSELFCYSFTKGEWIGKQLQAPKMGTIRLTTADDFSNRFFYSFENFLSPSTLYYQADPEAGARKIKSLPSFFDAGRFEVQQHEAISKDGTAIPYFVVAPKNMKYDGNNATLIYAYGGFEISMQPSYNAVVGKAWLERGGVYVLANLRGGGEFGPAWHQAGLKEHRQRVYDDFIAVSEDLITRKITSPAHLGIMGGSNGGLLVGVAFTERPDLYNAVVCSVPLLDMKRYNKLLAGASWMAEYGNPDIPGEWAYIKKYSPYQNVKATVKYPKVFFTTTTRDDRVHPGHARKMAAKMIAQGHPIYYFENTEGGHGSGVTSEQRALMMALEYTYLEKMLK